MRKRPAEPRAEVRETGTSGQAAAGMRKAKPATGLPPDPQDLGRPLSADEKVDEASLESMDGSDPPAHSSVAPGSPNPDEPSQPDEEAIRRRAYELWEADNRPAGTDQKHWHQASGELRQRAQQHGDKRRSK